MGNIIVIRIPDPDGDIFQSIIEAIQNENIQPTSISQFEFPVINIGEIKIFPAQRRVVKAGKQIHLNYGEFSMLCCMAKSPGQVFMRKAIRRGDLFYADLNPVVGSEQGGIRPVLVIQNDVGNHFSPTVVAAAITSRKAKNSLPTKLLITTAAQQLLTGKMTLAALRAEMTRIASQLPEYETVCAMYGVGETTAAQLMAEIGDVRRFPRRSSIVGFAGVDPGIDESGKHSAKSVPTTKRGSPHLRKTLYQIVCTYLKSLQQMSRSTSSSIRNVQKASHISFT